MPAIGSGTIGMLTVVLPKHFHIQVQTTLGSLKSTAAAPKSGDAVQGTQRHVDHPMARAPSLQLLDSISMRRCFAILLLALLPLQFSWAAVAAYCGHESDSQAQHLGHHEHQHADHAGFEKPADPAGQDAPAGLKFDCGHCHSHCCSMPATATVLTPLATASHPVTLAQGSLHTLPQTPPERPQWRRFA